MDTLYLISSGPYVKIGIANDVENRIASLQTGNPIELKVMSCFEFQNSSLVERVLHQKCASQRVRGEWFDLSTHEVEEIEKICIALGGIRNDIYVQVSNDEIEEAEEMQETSFDFSGEAKYDYAAMFSNGWRMENSKSKGSKGSHNSWIWRRGSGSERKSIYGGPINSLPYPIEEMRQRYQYDNSKD